MALLGVRVAPRDHEDLLALLDEPLDHAAAGREVEHVVLVDRRRDEQQRHARGPRSVCGAYWISSKTSVRSTTAPGVSARFSPTANSLVSTVDGQAREVAHEVARAAHEVHAALVDALLDDGRVRPREVVGASASSTLPAAKRAWRSSRQSRSASVIRPSTVSLDGEVRLQQPPEQPARLPRRVGEAAVALGRRAAPSGRSRRARARRRAAGAARRTVGSAGEAGGDARRDARAREAATVRRRPRR